MPNNIRFQNWFQYLFIHHTQKNLWKTLYEILSDDGLDKYILLLMQMFSISLSKDSWNQIYMLLYALILLSNAQKIQTGFYLHCRVGHLYLHTNVVVVLFILQSFILFRRITSIDYSVLSYVCLSIIGAWAPIAPWRTL